MKKFLPILILTILSDVVSNNSIVEIIENQNIFNVLALISIMLILQILTAPMQASISDYYCRKKSLIVALLASFISLLCLMFVRSPGLFPIIFLLCGILINACLGNIVPISWSALADMQEKNLRFFFALATSAYAIGYMILGVTKGVVFHKMPDTSWIWYDIVPPLIIAGVSIILVWKFYRDPKDRKPNTGEQDQRLSFIKIAHLEFKALWKETELATTRLGTLAYFCWASSQYIALFVFLESQEYSFSVIIMMVGYLVGVSILGFCKKTSDEKIIRCAYVITIIGFALFFGLKLFTTNLSVVISVSYFLYTLGNAFLSPSIFSLFSKERGFHDQGKGFGIIVSADSAGFLLAVIAAIVFKYFSLDINYIVLVSAIIFIISWIPYSIYEKTRKDIDRFLKKN